MKMNDQEVVTLQTSVKMINNNNNNVRGTTRKTFLRHRLSKCQKERKHYNVISIKSKTSIITAIVNISVLLMIIQEYSITQVQPLADSPSSIPIASQQAPPPIAPASVPSVQSTSSAQSRPEIGQDQLKSQLTLTDSVGQVPADFPGITKDVAAFCSARPSLQIDMASMIVHVKRNSSFNYKLYLFSEDYVFQTGQIVPRDDFRIHAFPVKSKRLRDFWPSDVSTFEEGLNSLKPLGSELFQYRRFFSSVLINPTSSSSSSSSFQSQARSEASDNPDSSSSPTINTQSSFPTSTEAVASTSSLTSTSTSTYSSATSPHLTEDVVLIDTPTSLSDNGASVDLKPVEIIKRRSTRSYYSPKPNNHFQHHSQDDKNATTIRSRSSNSGSLVNLNPNANIEFDRDDQVSLITAPQRVSPSPPDASSLGLANSQSSIDKNIGSPSQPVVINPSIMAALRLRQSDSLSEVGNINSPQDASKNKYQSSSAGSSSASSTSSQYMLAKDIYRDIQTIIPVGSFSSFHVNITYFVRKDFRQLKPELIKVGINANTFKVSYVTLIRDLTRGPNNEHSSDDYQFLTHRLLSDPNTRITAISQIYHDWITRNFYTVVYIQRLQQPAHLEPGDLNFDESRTQARNAADENKQQRPLAATLLNDRLIFRGSSANLLGAVQLDYGVRASAFITDKNGLHYFLDFLSSSNKFYIAAVDWTEKPFKFIDSQRFPIKVTRTLLDNEELLLCPPAFCHSVSPIDEIVAYGRLQLDDETQLAASILAGSFPPGIGSGASTANNDTALDQSLMSSTTMLDLDKVIDKVQSASKELKVKLHLRDWIWTLEQSQTGPNLASARGSLIEGRNLQKRMSGPYHPRPSSPISNTTSSSNNNNKLKDQSPTSNHSKQQRLYVWRYKWAQRNDIKGRHDIYGYPLTGNNIDAAFRVYNQVHLISANFLITINYTKANETSISKKPLVDEFQQLSSTIIDPISGVFYDRYANQVFFFKGDRYIGYDYATRKPIEDFLLNDGNKDGPIVLSSLPVVGILGRQHSVDGIYHDLSTDLVYIFEGMKFYSYDANEFKSGSFRSDPSKKLPPVRCINTHFLTGCHFDKAFPNPCRDSSNSPSDSSTQQEPFLPSRSGKSYLPPGSSPSEAPSTSPTGNDTNDESSKRWPFVPSILSDQFVDKQQDKVREMAKSKLINILGSENSFNAAASRDISGYVGLPSEPASVGGSTSSGRVSEITEQLPTGSTRANVLDTDATGRRHERSLIYMLASLVLLTIVATLIIVVMSIYSSTRRTHNAGDNHNGKISPTVSSINTNSTHLSGLPAPYDSLAQLQASVLQAAYVQQQQQQQQQQHNQNNNDIGKNNYANSASMNRYLATEPIMMLDDAPVGLLPSGPSSTYMRISGVDIGLPYGPGAQGTHSNSSTPPQGSLMGASHPNNHQPYIPQNTTSLVIKGRRYDTHNRRTDITDNSVL